MSAQPMIVGAGLAGLLAAHAWPRAQVLEARPRPEAIHKAVLRFRSRAASVLTGIEFREVLVRKGIWSEGAAVAPSIRCANLYAQKVLGRLTGDRSIWNTEPATRYIAPPDFYEQMVGVVGSRIAWGEVVDFTLGKGPLVSTAPLPVTLAAVGYEAANQMNFHHADIHVERLRVKGADLFQTIYFPDAATGVYRASFTGDLLIAEGSRAITPQDLQQNVFPAFGLLPGWGNVEAVGPPSRQSYGKIAPLEDAPRKAAMYHLTVRHNVFSLGRFATWRNILLDDVVDDIAVIKRLMRADGYSLRKEAS